MASRIRSASTISEMAPICWREIGEAVSTPSALVPANRTPLEKQLGAAALPLHDVEQQLSSRLRQEREEAYRQGEAAGRQRALAETEELVARLAHSIETIAGMKSRLRLEAERDVVALSLAVARRVLHRQVMVDEEAVLGLVKAAFDNAGLREVTEVRVHPNFLSRVQGHLSRIGAPAAIRVQGDATLELGGVIVETGRGSLDASLDTQLDEIGRGLADVLGRQH